MSVLDQIAVLSKELARIRSLVESNADATIITTKYTRDNVTATVNAALIALMPLTSLQDWPGLSAMYAEGKQKMNALTDMKLYSSPTSSNSVFCCGPGPLTVESTYIEPVWGIAALFPHLVRAKMSFFNGQIPLVRPSVYVPVLRNGLNMCGGRAIIVFYPPPWPAYLETAILAYLIGTGSTNISTIIPPARQQQLIAIATDTPIINIPGTYHGRFSTRDRFSEVIKIGSELMRALSNHTHDQHIYQSVHAGPNSEAVTWTLLDDISRATKGLDKDGTLAGSLSHAFKPALLTSVVKRNSWRDTILAPTVTDIGVCIHLIYCMAVLQQANDHNEILYLASKMQAIVLAVVDLAAKNPKSEHIRDIMPVIVFMNLLLPDNIQTLIE